jgi:phenylpropionate dioxygenase-like ring-hydroxylating dioxygenase large terminal subunit
MSQYLKNVWYAAGWVAELESGVPVGKTFLDIPVVMYRTEGGALVALFDRCPHRFAPLSKGKVSGNEIICPYHGLRFGKTGACVFSPHGNGRIPGKARVPAFPLVERHGLLWIWMGDGQAEEAAIPDLGFLLDPSYQVRSGDSLILGCNYQLAIDNLMDLSHAAFVHEKSFGNPALLQSRLEVKQNGSRISAALWMPSCLPGGAVFAVRDCERVDHWTDMEWSPASSLLLRIGSTAPGAPREAGGETFAPHLLTPETEFSTHYFFATARNSRVPSRPNLPSQRTVFETEDDPMLTAVQARMKTSDLWSLDPIFLPCDAGAVRVRRTLAGLMEAEKSATLAPSGARLGDDPRNEE